LNYDLEPVLENKPVSHDYGQLSDAVCACWPITGHISTLNWQIKSV
jgi:hypothetical protein